MLLKELEKVGLFEFRINIGAFFEKEDSEVYVVLGEPTITEFEKLSRHENLSVSDMIKLMENNIIDHNIESSPGKKVTNKEVVAFFNRMPDVFIEIKKTWISELPLVKKSREKSGNSVSTHSQED